MKRYIRSSLDSDLQKAMREYDARKKRLDDRTAQYEAELEPRKRAAEKWLEAQKNDPNAPAPNLKELDDAMTVKTVPMFDPEYSIFDAERNLTMKTLDYVAGTDMWVKINREEWIKVLSRTKNVRKYVYYKCQRFHESGLGSMSFRVTKYREDELKVAIPVEMLSEDEFCDFVSNKFFKHPDDDGFIASMIQENSTQYYPSF